MNLAEFLVKSEFSKQSELRRTVLLAFYQLRIHDEPSFEVNVLADTLVKLGYARPNTSRLMAALKKSRMFVSAGAPQSFKVHPSALATLDAEFPDIRKKSEEVLSQDSVVPEYLLQKDRAFVRSLVRQINSAYENNIFDGCAVLMRRLLEILLILSYQELKIESVIQDADGNFKQLNSIIDDAEVNKILSLSRNTRESLDIFRKLGNFSAHKIYYNASRKSIETILLDYRATIEELLYKSNLRT
jgi:hypothetical protein